MDSSLVKLHEFLLSDEIRPEDYEHDETACVICAGDHRTTKPEVAMSEKNYTEEEVQARVAEAVKPLEDQIRELEASEEAQQVEERISEATKPLDEKIEELESELDKATLRAEQAEGERDEHVKFWEDTAAEQEAAAALEEKKSDRVARVKEVANFSDEYITERSDRWAQMSDEDFDAALEDWRTISEESEKESKEGKLPSETSLKATGTKPDESVVSEVVNSWRKQGIDPRLIK